MDFGATSVRMLQLRDTGTALKVVGAARIDAPAEAPEGWVPSSAEVLSAFRSGGFSGRRCVLCLPRTVVNVQVTRLPKLPGPQMQQAVCWEASHRFGLDREGMEADYITTGAVVQGSDNREETLIVAAGHPQINAVLDPLIAAGLRPGAVETSFSALARIVPRIFGEPDEASVVRAVVELGATGACIMILQGTSVAFFRKIKVSGRRLDQAVREHLELEPHAAAELRVARIAAAAGSLAPGGINLDSSTDRAVFEAVRPLLNDLIEEVVLCLRYYNMAFRGLSPQMIVVTGGDGLEPKLGEMLEQRCKCPVAIADAGGALDDLEHQTRCTLNRSPGPAAQWMVVSGLSLRNAHQSVRERGVA